MRGSSVGFRCQPAAAIQHVTGINNLLLQSKFRAAVLCVELIAAAHTFTHTCIRVCVFLVYNMSSHNPRHEQVKATAIKTYAGQVIPRCLFSLITCMQLLLLPRR